MTEQPAAIGTTAPAADEAVCAAVEYAARGWRVFPVHSITVDQHCTCRSTGCDKPGKHPRTQHGLLDASTDPAIIRAWWKRWPDANVAIATGDESGLVVLDVDPRHGGEESLAEFERRYGKLPETVEVITGGGGRHIYFAHPGNGSVIRNATAIGGLGGLDLRGDGGYVVAPPSVHASGQRYEWEASSHPDDVPFAPLHKILATGLVAPEAPRADSGDGQRIPEGRRNATLTSLAGTMRRRGMSVAAIEAALLAENVERCDSELPEREVRAIAQSVARYPSGGVPIPVPIGDDRRDQNLSAFFTTARALAGEVPATVPYVVVGLLARGAITELAGKVKSSGKTTFSLALVRAVTTGRPFAGLPTIRTNVVYLTEQGRESFLAALDRAGLTRSDALTVLFWNRAAGVPWPGVVKAAVAKAKEIAAGLLVVDTIGQWAGLHGDDENSAGAALAAVQPLQLAAAEGLAVLVDRHARKSGGDVGDEGRGSSAFSGAMDVCLSLRRAEGNQPRVRVLRGLSRFSETPETLAIELTASGEYVALGDAATSAVVLAKNQLLACAPREPENATGMAALAKMAKTRRAAAEAASEELVRDGWLVRLGEGKRGSPFLYYLGPKAGGEADEELVPTQTYMPGRETEPRRAPPDPGNGDLSRDTLEPMIRAWLDTDPGSYVLDEDES